MAGTAARKARVVAERKHAGKAAKRIWRGLTRFNRKMAGPFHYSRTVLTARKALKRLYAVLHVRPGERAQKVLFDKDPPTDLDMIVADEGHHGGAASMTHIYNVIQPRYILAMSATPPREWVSTSPAPAAAATAAMPASSRRPETSFTAAYVRLNPYEFEQQLKRQTLAPAALDHRQLRRAQLIFEEELPKSFSLDLNDLSRDTWSLLPQAGDFLAEVRPRRFGTLTYARSGLEAEDIFVIDREKELNISVYPSQKRLEARGRSAAG